MAGDIDALKAALRRVQAIDIDFVDMDCIIDEWAQNVGTPAHVPTVREREIREAVAAMPEGPTPPWTAATFTDPMEVTDATFCAICQMGDEGESSDDMEPERHAQLVAACGLIAMIPGMKLAFRDLLALLDAERAQRAQAVAAERERWTALHKAHEAYERLLSDEISEFAGFALAHGIAESSRYEAGKRARKAIADALAACAPQAGDAPKEEE